MKFCKIIILSFSTLFLSKLTLAGDIAGAGFVNGNQFLEFEATEKELYLIGVLDGFVTADFLNPLGEGESYEDSKPRLKIVLKFRDCMKSKIGSSRQFKAIMDKYMNNNPEEWNQTMNLLVWNVISDLCDLPK